MSFVHFDEVYDICCEACIYSIEMTEPRYWENSNNKKKLTARPFGI
jgi:hypothetical protein